MQYLNAIQLICKSRGITDQNTVAGFQQKLNNILGTHPSIGVTVWIVNKEKKVILFLIIIASKGSQLDQSQLELL